MKTDQKVCSGRYSDELIMNAIARNEVLDRLV